MAETRQIVCPHCRTLNRLPATRAAGSGRCGACHQALFTATAVAVDGAGFSRHLAGNTIPVLADIWAPWCGPCRTMSPAFAAAAATLEPDLRLIKLDADQAPDITAELGVRSIPTLLLFQHGRELARSAGAMPTAAIIDWVRQHLKRTEDETLSHGG